MTALRYIASRPLAGLFWLLWGIAEVAWWAAAWVAVGTWAVRGMPEKPLTPEGEP